MSYLKTTDGIVIPIVINSALYQDAVTHFGSTRYLYHQDTTHDTIQEAEERAEEYAERVKHYLFENNIPIATAYIQDDTIENRYDLLKVVKKDVGSYQVNFGGTDAAPLLVYAKECYTIYAPRLSEPYGIFYQAGHTDPSPGFQGYNYDGAIYQLLPESIIDNGRVSINPNTVLRQCTIGYSAGLSQSLIGSVTVNHATGLVSYLMNTDQVNIASWLIPRIDGAEVFEESEPYEPGGMSGVFGPGGSAGIGGDGTFSRTGGHVPLPTEPTISATQTGLVTLYVGNVSAANNLANYLWSSAFDVDTFKKLFSNPMDVIIGASILPCTPQTGTGNPTIIFGNVDTEVPMPIATKQFHTVSCGTVAMGEYWKAYLDYSPYTKAHIFLPYIGFKELNVDEIMGKLIGVQYIVDCLSGACTASVYTQLGSTKDVLYQYSGSCATQVPLTANNWGQAIGSIIQVAGQAIGGVTAGGAAGALISGGSALAQNAISGGFKPDVQRNGSVTGSGGWLGVQNPYIILEWPRQSSPQNYSKFSGYPSNATLLLSQCHGYTKVEEINLDQIPCTGSELSEIEALLKGGVII